MDECGSPRAAAGDGGGLPSGPDEFPWRLDDPATPVSLSVVRRQGRANPSPARRRVQPPRQEMKLPVANRNDLHLYPSP